MLRLRRLLVVAAAFVLFSACKVDVSVGIDARADGHGEIRVTALLDKEAAEELGDIDERLRTDDLEEAGWEVEPPERLDDGGVSITVRHVYDSPSEATQILADLGGNTGSAGDVPPDAPAPPFDGFTLTQDRSFFRTTTRFSGTVNLARGVEAFSDARLQESLGGTALGVPVEQLERQLRTSFDRIFGLQVAVRMPGKVTSNAPTTTDNGAVWAPRLGERVDLVADAARWNIRNIALLVVAVVSTVALIVVLVLRRRAPTSEGSPAPVN